MFASLLFVLRLTSVSGTRCCLLSTGVFCAFVVLRLPQNRLVSLVHALLSSSFALHYVLKERVRFGQANTEGQTFTLAFSCAYFIFDFALVTAYEAWHQSIDLPSLFHHLVSLATLGYGVVHGRCGGEMISCLLMMELSNPFMHTIHILRELRLGDSASASVNKKVFALVFFVCRILVGPVLTYKTLINPTSAPIIKAGAAGMQLVSILWFHKIVRMATRSGPDRRSPKQS